VEPKVLNFEESSLESLGWSSFFQNQMANGGRAGRVASANHGRFLVWTADGEVDASVTGVLRKSGALWPAVGDWVVLKPDGPVIDRVLERRTKL